MRPSGALIVALLGLAAWLLPQSALTTVPLAEQANALGYPAEDCSYCHTFSRAHMTEAARRVGLSTTNCITCHGGELPLSGFELFNERGRFLLDEKQKREADKADMVWLDDYVEAEPEDEEPKEKKASPDPGH